MARGTIPAISIVILNFDEVQRYADTGVFNHLVMTCRLTRTGIIECEIFAATYRRFGLQTIRSPVVEIEALVAPFENGRGCTLDVQRVGTPRNYDGLHNLVLRTRS